MPFEVVRTGQEVATRLLTVLAMVLVACVTDRREVRTSAAPAWCAIGTPTGPSPMTW